MEGSVVGDVPGSSRQAELGEGHGRSPWAETKLFLMEGSVVGDVPGSSRQAELGEGHGRSPWAETKLFLMEGSVVGDVPGSSRQAELGEGHGRSPWAETRSFLKMREARIAHAPPEMAERAGAGLRATPEPYMASYLQSMDVFIAGPLLEGIMFPIAIRLCFR
jgi:hypothetical protein